MDTRQYNGFRGLAAKLTEATAKATAKAKENILCLGRDRGVGEGEPQIDPRRDALKRLHRIFVDLPTGLYHFDGILIAHADGSYTVATAHVSTANPLATHDRDRKRGD